jgi:hypothetical protein
MSGLSLALKISGHNAAIVVSNQELATHQVNGRRVVLNLKTDLANILEFSFVSSVDSNLVILSCGNEHTFTSNNSCAFG